VAAHIAFMQFFHTM